MGSTEKPTTATRSDQWPPKAPEGTKMADLVKETGRDDNYVYHGKVKVAKELDGDWVKAQTYLGKSQEAVNSLHDLVHGKDTLTVEKVDDGNDRFRPSENKIFWDPKSAMVTTGGGKQTAANGLLHEQGHANEYKNHPERYVSNRRTFDGSYSNKEEKRNIEWEQVYSKELGEDIRHDHGGRPFDSKGPTSLEPSKTVTMSDPGEVRMAIASSRAQLSGQAFGAPPEPGDDSRAIAQWDGKSHTGAVVHLDGNTVAQAVTDARSGQVQYQLYDVNKDLNGVMPPAGGPRTTILENGQIAGHHGPELAAKGPER